MKLNHPKTLVVFLALMASVHAEEPSMATAGAQSSAGGDDAAELAKKLSNPVASLISLPVQANWDFGIGLNDATRLTVNVQPVIPISLSDDLNLIIRTIMPVIDAEAPSPGVENVFGLGDFVQSFFFSPSQPTGGGWILGAGPVFLWPTATDSLLGSEKWGAGPTGLALKQSGGWTYGALANHIWSYAGDDSRDEISATFLQPFVSYTTESQTTIGLNAESSYDWTHEQWSVPLNLTVSQLVKIAGRPMQLTAGGRYYVEGPDGGPEWGLRAGITFLFPN
ncbi:MAG: hypothetical protein ACI8XO_001489 [Verrucomicrobiales bacterium]|jgi:hypothetical protein